VNINLHLTDDTELRAHGFVAASGLFAEVQWDFSRHANRLSEGALWGTPAMMRQLAALAVQAAIQAEEEACWQARQHASAAAERSRVA
jgi:predicted membrane protein